jgi:hypothetical protein
MGSIAGAAFFGSYAYIAAADLHQLLGWTRLPSSLVYVSLIRLGVSTAGAAGFIVYLLGWLRRVHNEDVRAERDLERYRYDVDRASWAIETILEAQEKQSGIVPDRWIDGVTHALFVRTEEPPEDGGAVQIMSQILDVAARAKIGPNGTELEINRGGLRKLAKEKRIKK